MKINRKNAMYIWENMFGDARFANDFHGRLMCKNEYGDPDFFIYKDVRVLVGYQDRIYCGWNIHHILPLALGGTNAMNNLICTNIATNAAAEDKITFWIDDTLYQVKRICGTSDHEIVRIQ